jgi:hypothetical protein
VDNKSDSCGSKSDEKIITQESDESKMKITQVYDFAGEAVE